METFDWVELAKDRLWITMTVDLCATDSFASRAAIVADLTRRLAVLIAEHANDPHETAALKRVLAVVEGATNGR